MEDIPYVYGKHSLSVMLHSKGNNSGKMFVAGFFGACFYSFDHRNKKWKSNSDFGQKQFKTTIKHSDTWC